MTSGKDPWLRPFEFQLIQRLSLSFGVWSGGDLLNDLEHWVRNDVRQDWWVRWFEDNNRIRLRYYLSRMAGEFLSSVGDVWEARRYAKEYNNKNMLETQERLGPARLVWMHGRPGSNNYYSANYSSPRLRGTFNFGFTGQRAGSEWHRDIITEYANILQRKGRFVTVDTGAVESKLPDITFWTPHTPLEWWSGGAIEVEMEAYRKSDQAIMRNLEKHLKNQTPVRFVVLSEKSFERVSGLIEQKTRIIPQRVENYLGQMNNPVQIEVIDSPTGHPYMDFLRSEKVLGRDKAAELAMAGYPRIMTPWEQEKEKRDIEEAHLPEKWQRAWELAEQGDGRLLDDVRRGEYRRRIEEEDSEYLAKKRARGGRFRVLQRRHWPKHDTQSNEA
jgi:hypothetical protein